MSDYYKISFPDLVDKAERVFNKYIRERDKSERCISCSNPVEHACHLYSANIFWWLRFDEVNVNGGCRTCNFYQHPVKTENYINGIILRHGTEAYDDLVERSKQERSQEKPDRDYYIGIIETYSKKRA